MLAHTILMSLAGLALAVPFPDSNHHVAPRAKRDDNAIIASKCGSPCEIRFSAITTTMTVSAPPQTMNIDGIDHPVTVTFTPVTTATMLQPAAKTVENTDPAATPTISVDAVNLGSVTLFGSAYNYNWNVAAHAQMYTSPHPYVLANSMNPYHLDSNCAFVTMAKLVNMGLHPFLNMIGMMQNADHGISTAELKQALSEIRLHGNFMTWYEEIESGDTRTDLEHKIPSPDQLLGVGYMRNDGNGHVVVYDKLYRKFFDYQSSDRPSGVLKDGNGQDIEDLMQPRPLGNGRWATGFVFGIE